MLRKCFVACSHTLLTLRMIQYMTMERFNSSAFLILFAACSFCCNVTWIWRQKEISISYLEAAISMILKAEENSDMCRSCGGCRVLKPADCADLLHMGNNRSGVYEIWPMNKLTEGRSLSVFCDMDTDGGGWTVLQRRGDFQRPKDYFFQNWESYKKGFGDIQRDFWLGNDNIFALTNQKLYSVRFYLADVEQTKKYALYDKFWIDDESKKYTLHISDYSGNAGDSMISAHNNQKFSTKDQDNDQWARNCAEVYKGAWWYNACHQANLNGLYLEGKHESVADGINWYSWKGHMESLKYTEIKIRPKSFRLSYASEVPPF